MSQYIEPIRYKEQVEPQHVEKRVNAIRGVKWVIAVFALSWYMFQIGAVTYSLLFFLGGLAIIAGVVGWHIVVRPKPDMETQKRYDLLDRWTDV